jgi:hypothetical protein
VAQLSRFRFGGPHRDFPQQAFRGPRRCFPPQAHTFPAPRKKIENIHSQET